MCFLGGGGGGDHALWSPCWPPVILYSFLRPGAPNPKDKFCRAKNEKAQRGIREVVRGCKGTPILRTVFVFVLLLGMIVMRRCDSSSANLLTVLIKGNSVSLPAKTGLIVAKRAAAYREGLQGELAWSLMLRHECFRLRSGLVNNSITHLRFCKGKPKNNQGWSALTPKSVSRYHHTRTALLSSTLFIN